MSECIRDPKGHNLHLPEQNLIKRKPYPTAPFYQYPFTVECSKCHASILLTGKTERDRELQMAKYPKLPKFPH
jgi:hypothetical protein